MSTNHGRRSITLFGFLALVSLVPGSARAQGQGAGGSADARLRALYTEEWNWRQREQGRGQGDRFARVDAASQEARLQYWTKALAALNAIPHDQLSPEEKVNAQVFGASLHALVSDARFRLYETPFNSDTFFWTSFTPRQGLPTAAGYRAFLARLRDVPRHFDEQTVNMRAGLARGFSVPRVSVVGRDLTIVPYTKTDATNPLFAPFTMMPASLKAEDQEALRAEAAAVIRDVVAPAYEKLLAFMRNEYLPKTRTTLAAV